MAVHRISDRAELLLQRLAAAVRKKPGQLLSELVVDYAAGLTFENDPELENLQTPDAEGHVTPPADPETNEET
jgi:hypothetical protein